MSHKKKKPVPPPFPTADLVPKELKGLKRWIGWKAEWDEEKQKWNKPPYSALDGFPVGDVPKSKDGKDNTLRWLTFDEALAGAQKHKLDGVGFIFVKDSGYVGVDFDHCRKDGVICDAVQNWFAWFPSYTEVSPSATGIHILCKGTIPKALKADLPASDGTKVECYSKGRYFTFTGQNINNCMEIVDCQDSLNKFYKHLGVDSSGIAPEDHPQRPMSAGLARRFHKQNLAALRAAPMGIGNATLNSCAYFAARAHAALNQTEQQIKDELLHIVTKEWAKPHGRKEAEDTIASGWTSGALAPFTITKLEPWEEQLEITLEQMNAKYMIVQNVGGKPRVAWFEKEHHEELKGMKKLTYASYGDFNGALIKETVCIGPDEDGVMMYMPKAKWWLGNRRGRIYTRVIYLPGKDTIESLFNLWEGFSVEPKKGDCSKYLWHVKHIICSGNPEHYTYLLSWLARAVQMPFERGHVAIVLRGRKGPGKNLFADGFGNLFGAHYMVITNCEHLVGRFNSHLRAKSVICANEAFFAGDKKHEATLKGLITDPVMPIEQKFVDAETDVNLGHILVLSNSDWVVPAGEDERRYFAMDVSGEKIGDFEYFRKIRYELDHGGSEALLHYLLHEVDISGFEPRRVPETDALRSQMSESLTGIDAAWFECLCSGEIPGFVNEDGTVWMRGSDLIVWAKNRDVRQWSGISTEKVSNLLGTNLRFKDKSMGFGKIEKPLPIAGNKDGQRYQMWVIPKLAEARAKWVENKWEHTWSENSGWVSVRTPPEKAF
jgi:hypothetical protein